jgi:hypothetical protein
LLKPCRKVIVKYPIGYRFPTVLGIALSTVLVVFLKISLGNYSFSIPIAIGLLLVCYLISGIVGMMVDKCLIGGIVGIVLSVSSIIFVIMVFHVAWMGAQVVGF